MRPFLALLLLSLLPLAAADKNLVTIRLHGEGKEADTDTFTTSIELTNPARKLIISKVPIITERDIVSFYPFSAADGSIGAYLRLDADGGHKLASHTIAYRDTLVVAMINGRVSSAMMVDKKIEDGVLLISSGFLPSEIAQMQTKFPIMGKEKEFSQQKKYAQKLIDETNKAAKEKKKK